MHFRSVVRKKLRIIVAKTIANRAQIEYNINRKVDVIPLVRLTPKIRSDAGRKSLRLAGNDKT